MNKIKYDRDTSLDFTLYISSVTTKYIFISTQKHTFFVYFILEANDVTYTSLVKVPNHVTVGPKTCKKACAIT